MILFGIIWLLTVLTKIAGIVNSDDLFPIYIGAGFIIIAILIGKFASNFENKYDK
jgi:hypothetical protein